MARVIEKVWTRFLMVPVETGWVNLVDDFRVTGLTAAVSGDTSSFEKVFDHPGSPAGCFELKLLRVEVPLVTEPATLEVFVVLNDTIYILSFLPVL